MSDNGSQFVGIQFKGYIADCGFEHRRPSVCYPQSNGTMKRQFRTTKEELRQRSIIDVDDFTEQISNVINDDNTKRYHSAPGYVTPLDVVQGREDRIKHQRREILDEAQGRRKQKKHKYSNKACHEITSIFNLDNLF
ncbi:MAG: hypothetical protein OKBPIBMD_00887 [Chlorobi bacterium]|nr:hypothetical protein [Chlorobiota bacterium]MBZ0195165.1 integrase core domain-containing protein [Candidatus Kapabacteria bacterium]